MNSDIDEFSAYVYDNVENLEEFKSQLYRLTHEDIDSLPSEWEHEVKVMFQEALHLFVRDRFKREDLINCKAGDVWLIDAVDTFDAFIEKVYGEIEEHEEVGE